MYAIIEAGGKQHKVVVGQTIEVEKLDVEVGTKVEFPVLLVAEGENALVGKDASAKKCEAEVVSHGRGKKLIVFKYKAKKNIRKKTGHRQSYTAVKIVSIA